MNEEAWWVLSGRDSEGLVPSVRFFQTSVLLSIAGGGLWSGTQRERVLGGPGDYILQYFSSWAE